MAGSVNKVILVGNLGADPEVRSTQNGKKIANLSLATSESWKNAGGEKQTRTQWHRIVILSEGLVGIVERYLRKGSKVYLEGQLQTRKWQDQQGNDRYTTEVILGAFNSTLTMLDRAGSDGPSAIDSSSSMGSGGMGSGGSGDMGYGDDSADEDAIPF